MYHKDLFWDPFFYLCVADMKNILDGSECIQYADDSTIYCRCKI